MTRKATGQTWSARVLMLLSALLLIAAPIMPSAATMPRGDCCEEMPCHDQGKKAPCHAACAIACQIIVAPEAMIVGSVEIRSAPIAPMTSLMLPSRVLAPELPPPR